MDLYSVIPNTKMDLYSVIPKRPGNLSYKNTPTIYHTKMAL